MPAATIAVLCAVLAVAAWAAKAVAIAVAGGLDESPLEGPLFVVGLVAIVAAFGAFGVALAGRRAIGYRALAGVAGALLGLGAVILVESLVGALVPSSAGWVQEEAGLWVAAALTAALLIVWYRRRETSGPATSA